MKQQIIRSLARLLLIAVAAAGVAHGQGKLASIDNNYWGGADPVTATGTQPGPMVWDGTNTNSDGVSYTASTSTTLFSLQGHSYSVNCSGGLYAWSGSLSCGDGLTRIVQSDDNTKVPTVQTEITDTCAYLKIWEYMSASDSYENQRIYDTLRLYVEHCAASDDRSYTAFGSIDGAVGQIVPASKALFAEYRDWLISVIYLNTSEAYFCNCLNSIGGTYRYDPSINPTTAYMTILNYLRQHPSCHGQPMDEMYTNDSLYLIKNDIDPTKLPSLDSLGLGFLLDHNAVPSVPIASTGLHIASFTGSPNPFTKSTDLTFTLNRMTYVTIAIYDELGRMYWGDGKGRSLDMGTHTIHIDGADLPSGTLYARISTGFGEVKTVKLIKN